MKRYIAIAAMTVGLGTMFAPAAHASPQISVQIGPAAPYRDMVWQPGHYVRTAFGVRWVRGAWVRRPYVRRYDAGRFGRFDRSRVYGDRDGRWDGSRRDWRR